MKFIILFLSAVFAFSGYTQNNESFTASILVTNFNEEPISQAQVEFYSKAGKLLKNGTTNDQGRFELSMVPGEYQVKLKQDGELKKEANISIPPLEGRHFYNVVSIQILYQEETTFTIDDLHFESGSAEILPASYPILDKLVKFLKEESGKYEIAGHTDSDGSTADNLKLSQDRAAAVKSYLVERGISADRLIAQGYGESEPIATNDSAQGKAQNRRTEIRKL